MASVCCYSLLDFELADDVSWQGDVSNRPSVNEMINSISRQMNKWEKVKSSQKLIKEFIATYLLKTCEQEDIGITDVDVIHAIMTEVDECSDTKTSVESSYVETSNLYKAYRMLQDLRNPPSNEIDDEITKGLVEIDACVIDIHKCLMKGLPMKTPPGQFSTDVRKTTACGEVHEYPKFETELEASDAVIRVLDRYNDLYYSLKNKVLKEGDRVKFLENFFKSAAYLFYNLVSLHPFGDGNGRLCRLILNYVLESVFPFPIPLSDISPIPLSDVLKSNSRNVYIDAVVSPRKSDGFPRQLTSLIIESTYLCCKRFTEEMEMMSKAVVIFNAERAHHCIPRTSVILTNYCQQERVM